MRVPAACTRDSGVLSWVTLVPLDIGVSQGATCTGLERMGQNQTHRLLCCLLFLSPSRNSQTQAETAGQRPLGILLGQRASDYRAVNALRN